MLLATALWLKEKVSVLQTLSLALLLAISAKTQGLLLTRAVWICINTTLCHFVKDQITTSILFFNLHFIPIIKLMRTN